jgi:N-acylglucosamine-6-phosphate 2-epimerase
MASAASPESSSVEHRAVPGPAALAGGLIVSVQAPEGSPLREPTVIAAMAEASLARGAIGVRLESPEHIGAVRRRCPEALIVGLWKRSFPGSSVYITPRWEDLRAVWAAGADVVALDATERPRPEGETLEELVNRAREELGAPLMADVDSLENALRRQLPASVALICEGGIAAADQAALALERGADAVVVGTAITGVDLQVQAYVAHMAGRPAG